jgi:hypothetical protein
MITLTCTKCQTVMEMDDAFAGGVCRCQHCGTIQTVPSHLKRSPAGGTPAKSGKQKALYSGGRGSSSGVPSSGLDDLANAVASSGLSSGLANQPRGSRPTTVDYAKPGTVKPPASKLPLVVGLVVLLAAVGAGAYFLLKPAAPTPPVPGGSGPGVIATPGANDPAIAGPQFVGIPLDYGRVVFVIDRGQAGIATFDALKVALFDAVTSLGPQREFQVLFWTPNWTPNGAPNVDEFAYPKGSTARGNPDRVAGLRKHLEDVMAVGSTDPGPALKAAAARNPDAIVITTAKADQLGDPFVKLVAAAVKGKPVVVHTVDLSSDGGGRPVLEAVAKAGGGKYVHVPPSKLK